MSSFSNYKRSTRTVVMVGSLALIMNGCVSYRAAPIDQRAMLRDLQRVTLEDLVARTVPDEHTPTIVSLADGLTTTEAAAIAIVGNPGLRAKRQSVGIAQGQLIQAGLFPNPEIDATWFTPSATGAQVNALFDVTGTLLTRGLERDVAAAQADRARMEVLESEWDVAFSAQQAVVDLAYAQRLVEMDAQRLAIASRTTEYLTAQHQQGFASEFAQLVAESDELEIKRQALRNRADSDRFQRSLALILGLPPQITAAPADDVLSLETWEPPSDPDTAILRRFDITLAQGSYDVAEHELQLAIRKQYPSLKLGPSWQGGDASGFGFGIQLDLPLFNRHQGKIAAKQAQREQRRLEMAESLHRARAELADATADTQTLAAEADLIRTELVPRIERTLELSEELFTAGGADILQVLAVQRNALNAKSEALATIRDLHHARLAVLHAAGPG